MDEREGGLVELFYKLVDQLEGEQAEGHLWVHIVLKHQVVVVFLLDEVLWLELPLVEIWQGKIMRVQKLDELPRSVLLSVRVLWIVSLRIWHLEHLSILVGCLFKLWLKVLELHRRAEEADLAIALRVVLTSLVVNRGCDHRVHGVNRQLLYSGVVELHSEDDLSNSMDILAQTFVEKQGFRDLELIQSLQKTL